MEEVSFGAHDWLANKIRKKAGRGGAYRAPIPALCALIDYARETSDEARAARQLEALELLDACMLDLQADIQADALREALLMLALAQPAPGVELGVLQRIWREPRRCKASWRGPEFKRWLCDMPWSYGDRERALKLVRAAQDEVWDDDALLPMLVDNWPASERALARRREAGPVPAEHAVGLFMRHTRERSPDTALLTWLWRGVSAGERERILLMMQESPTSRQALGRGVLAELWRTTERFQEHTALLRVWGLLPGEMPVRSLVSEALQSEHAALRAEAIAVFRRLGTPGDVTELLAASEGRDEAERKQIEEAIRAIQRRAGSTSLGGALTLQEDAGERGGLSLAGAQAGELTDAREASEGAQASHALVAAAPHGPDTLVRREASGWLEASPAPRPLGLGVRAAYLGLPRRMSDRAWLLGWSFGPTLLAVLASMFERDVGVFAIYLMMFAHFVALPTLYSRRQQRLRALERGAIMLGEVDEGGREVVVDGARYPLTHRWRGASEVQPVIVESGRAMLAASEFYGLEVTSAGQIVTSRWRAAAGVVAILAVNHITFLLIPGGFLACIVGVFNKAI